MLKILLVDDSKSAQLKTSSILSKYGACDMAFNGLEAVHRFRESVATECNYDLIVMDVVMPIMDGFEATQQIMRIQQRKNLPDSERPKIIMLTSRSNPENFLKAHLEVGVKTYITKPFEEETLVEALNNMGLITTH